jgi:hypothetical protein
MKKASLLLFTTIATALVLPQARGEAVFEGTPDPAQFVLNFGAVASGDAVNVDTTDSDETWRTWLISRPEAIAFEPGKRYRASWDYEVQKNKGAQTHYYYYFQSADDQDSRRGNGKWLAKDGESGQMEVTATLGNFEGYVFALGISKGGAITIKNLKVEEVPPPKLDKGFLYQPPFENDGRLALNSAGHFVKGGFEVDTTTGGEWNESLATSPKELPLQPGHTYRVAFAYDVKNVSDKGDNSMVCRLAKPDGSNIEGQWNSWPVSVGERGRKELFFTVLEPGCSIRLGDRNGLKARVEEFSIEDTGK